ncbi:MAG: recombinase family protein [Thermoleophilaceae bacterium]|nr:recombinase family protein [Thermoleophilaceae bacterium]
MNAQTIAQKASAEHLQRAAYLYVRQSTLRQVHSNTESAERQYALRQRTIALGWPADQIVVIDSDQGQSGASSAEREGFQRLVADVGLGKAGIVLGLEVSRLARNNADWHRLLEICALSGTLICDEDGLYDPADFNDRLLLGLKGTMSEAELHFIRARLQGGILSKARRGELPLPLPVGLVYDPAGRVVLDPDAAVQQALGHLFATFERSGSARAVAQAFNRDGLLFPARVRSGERKGELTWSPLTHWRVLRTLHNPRFAGAFAYGQRRTRKGAEGKTTTRQVPREQWTLIKDAHPGYISFEQYEHNLKTLAANATAHGTDRAGGPAREGPALLQGLAICGRCGRRMTVRYHARNGVRVPDYQCVRENIQAATGRCLVIPGAAGVDEAIGKLLLDTVTPLALEVALGVQAELEARAEEADRLRRTHVERARHHAELARRRYLAVDPDNRLVADTLEADWNEALRALRAAHDEYERQAAAAGAALSEERKQRIRQLASDFPALWTDPATPPRERKRIARLLIEDVTLNKTDRIHLHVRFRGGQTKTITIPRALNAWEARQTPPDTLAEIDRLLDEHTDAEVAAKLNEAGRRSGTNQPFTRTMIIKLRRSNGLPSRHERLRARGMLTQQEIATRLGVRPKTIHAWRRAGLLAAHRANDKNDWLYQPPTPGDPRLRKQQGRRLSDQQPARSTPGGAM